MQFDMISLDNSFGINCLISIDRIDEFIESNDYTNDSGCFCIDARKDIGEPLTQGVVYEA